MINVFSLPSQFTYFFTYLQFTYFPTNGFENQNVFFLNVEIIGLNVFTQQNLCLYGWQSRGNTGK